jgi:peroxiredoxin
MVLFLIAGCGEPQKRLKNGEAAPGFSLERLDGNQVSFPDQYRGRIVAIRFWADWCPFCEDEMKQLEPVYEKYRDHGLVILALNVRQDRAKANRFIKRLNITYDTLLDREGEVARSYGVIGLPTTYFVDAKGVLKTRIIGESTPETFERIIIKLMQEKTVAQDGG